MFAGLIFVFLSNYFNVLSPQVAGFVIDFVQQLLPGYTPSSNPPRYDTLVTTITSWISSGEHSWIKVVALSGITILLLALLRGVFLFMMRQSIIVMSRHIEYDQKNEIYDQYQQLDTAFYKTHSTGDLMNRIAEDVSRVRMYTGPAVMYLANLIAIISLSVFFMVKRDVELTLYVLAPLPILAITIYLVNNTINKKSEKIQATLSDLTTNAQESYSGIRVIKSFVQEVAMIGFFQQKSEEYRKNAISLAKVEAIYFPSITFLIGLSTLITIMIGGLHHIYNPERTNLATIVEFVMYVNMLTFPVSAIGLTASMIQRAAASQKRINEFLDINPVIRKKQGAQNFAAGNISFRHAGFVYPHTGIVALKDFNLEIKAGQKIAIVGNTGSGKSTIAQLLLRKYEATGGAITIGEIPVAEIDLHQLRENISYVPQDVFLFSDTVAGNIAFGKRDATILEIETAAKQAVIHDEIERFPEKYHTLIGERGVTLSGGQKQRISIARALLKNAPIVIFDDCLSAVDTRTEYRIVAALNQYLETKTGIFITHRIFASLHFDKIIVLDNGSILEAGTHEHLLAANGYYAKMFASQQSRRDTES